MQALICKQFGPIDALQVGEMPAPVPGAGQVAIDVEAASVNFPDGLMVQGKYQLKPGLPFVPGAEIAGTVHSAGDGVTQLKPGDRVVALCRIGGFAQRVVADADSTFALAPAVDISIAAAMPLTYATTYHALLDRARLTAGETLLVLGAGGGVGIAAVELGKLMGATVIAAASSPEKLEAARSRGADHLIDYSQEDLRARLKEIAGSKGVDVVYDPVGGPYTEPALRAVGWGGRYLVVGFAAGEIPRIPLNLTLLKGSSIVGVYWGEFRHRDTTRSTTELTQLLKWLEEGRIRPIVSAKFSLEDAASALASVLERRAVGKVIILPRQSGVL
ncbi:MAG: NADPH:quinone reductase [Gammaproteobacteria bacterium]|jgi:NADPH2:quinone reductase|nr:NADPH:quinone reductase [Gammaproteobacteria bacterium]